MDIYFIRSVFDYDGRNLIWKTPRARRCKVGDVAGYLDVHGYRKICLFGKRYYAHHLIWLWHHGTWPEKDELDHINRIPDDNRIENLREVTHQENMENMSLRKDNSSGHVGVCKISKKWRARIVVNGKQVHLGYFDTFDEACLARDQAKGKFHI